MTNIDQKIKELISIFPELKNHKNLKETIKQIEINKPQVKIKKWFKKNLLSKIMIHFVSKNKKPVTKKSFFARYQYYFSTACILWLMIIFGYNMRNTELVQTNKLNESIENNPKNEIIETSQNNENTEIQNFKPQAEISHFEDNVENNIEYNVKNTVETRNLNMKTRSLNTEQDSFVVENNKNNDLTKSNEEVGNNEIATYSAMMIESTNLDDESYEQYQNINISIISWSLFIWEISKQVEKNQEKTFLELFDDYQKAIKYLKIKLPENNQKQLKEIKEKFVSKLEVYVNFDQKEKTLLESWTEISVSF